MHSAKRPIFSKSENFTKIALFCCTFVALYMAILKGNVRGKLVSMDGDEIDRSKTITIELNNDNLQNSLAALKNHKNKYSNDLLEALKADFLEILKSKNYENLEATDENAEILLNYIKTKISLETLNANEFNNKFIEQFKNLCTVVM